jgi:ABC-type sugar transport system permease subunit
VLATPTLLPAIIYLVAMIQAPFLLTLWYSFHGFSLLQVKVQML